MTGQKIKLHAEKETAEKADNQWSTDWSLLNKSSHYIWRKKKKKKKYP